MAAQKGNKYALGAKGNTIKKYDAAEIADRLNNYINNNNNPVLCGFCMVEGNPCRDWIYEQAKTNQDLADMIKRAKEKEQYYRLSGESKNPSVDIFVLKQPRHGYTDKQQTELTAEIVVKAKLPDELKELSQ